MEDCYEGTEHHRNGEHNPLNRQELIRKKVLYVFLQLILKTQCNKLLFFLIDLEWDIFYMICKYHSIVNGSCNLRSGMNALYNKGKVEFKME